MDGVRQQKISRLLQKELSEVFQRESRMLFGPVFITVTMVRVSPDLSIAKVYLSLFPVKDKHELFIAIKEASKDIRRHLGSRIKNQVRIIPHLEFFVDDSLDYAEKIDMLLKK